MKLASTGRQNAVAGVLGYCYYFTMDRDPFGDLSVCYGKRFTGDAVLSVFNTPHGQTWELP